MKKIIAITLVTSLIFISCTNNEDEVFIDSSSKNSQAKNAAASSPSLDASPVYDLPANLIKDFTVDLENLVVPSECETTIFNDVINQSVNSNLDALGANFFNLYSQMNFFYTITDESDQFFGNEGQYTNYVVNRTRSLENFWEMPNEISVRGQHNSTLNDRDKLIQIRTFWYGDSPAIAALNADFLISVVNAQSTFLIETPLISFDGFAIALDGFLGQGDLIVIGDGLVELASEAGVEDKVVWTGILAHEWAHQIQFNNSDVWYPNGAADNAPEATRTTELEADFFAAYYSAHKRGATYNWKRIEDFNELFFNIGDCSFTSSGHHGTPLQRMEAARQGYELADNTFPKGKILTKDQVHEAFINVLDDIVN